FVDADLIVVSPGVPLDIEPLLAAGRNGIEIVGELEWAWRQVDRPTLAVTGTNGKTTTTSLLGEIFHRAGRRVFVGGNIGTPLSQWILNGGEAELLILEVSSFQLDTASRFRPDVGILLNVTEDHLDRYEGFKGYADSKLSLFARQGRDGVAIVNFDDSVCASRWSEIPGRVWPYSRKRRDVAAFVEDKTIRIRVPDGPAFDLDLEHAALKGVHNEENIMAAALAAAAFQVTPPVVQQEIDRYAGLPHRVEWVRTWRGIAFYDDSKATNVGAVEKALENFDAPIWLLLGGRDKLGSYDPLIEPMRTRGKGVIAFGEAAPRIQAALGADLETRSVPDLAVALEEALRRAVSGDIVLLSPACSSFDQYTSYAQRGDHFKRLVHELADSQ
ncbi:MAG: UDP-N-acetylmuramoyl-L-alanine--D-glutamate ligase, partial [Syntrophobacteraceae bacterium]|nr:UDP-N-acetylmuramoyl-L-alanine--D-glutamate ligase [Syntrophobacteraceae bacterium]